MDIHVLEKHLLHYEEPTCLRDRQAIIWWKGEYIDKHIVFNKKCLPWYHQMHIQNKRIKEEYRHRYIFRIYGKHKLVTHMYYNHE